MDKKYNGSQQEQKLFDCKHSSYHASHVPQEKHDVWVLIHPSTN